MNLVDLVSRSRTAGHNTLPDSAWPQLRHSRARRAPDATALWLRCSAKALRPGREQPGDNEQPEH
eukprot:13816288-Alexandrium_andersonii.AAC.1